MKRTISKTLLNQWAEERERPVIELAVLAGISVGMASELLRGTYRGGQAPESSFKRRSIAKVIGVTEDEVFPLAA